jgi:hypothetical protein
MLAVGRVSRPEELAKRLAEISGMPLPSAAEAVAFAAGPELSGAVDMEKPVDFAVAMTLAGRMPRPTFALSLPLHSIDEAKSKLGKFKLSPADNGATRVEGLLPPEESGDAPQTCLIAPAVGATPARLVCGEVAGVEALTPYLTRTFPRETTTSNVHLELRTGANRETIESLRRLLPNMASTSVGGRNHPALNDLVMGVVGDATDFATDSEVVVLDIDVKSEGVHGTVRVPFKTTTSTASKVALGQGLPKSAPASIARLPEGTVGSIWSTGSPPQLFDHFQATAKRAFLEAASHESNLTDKEREQLGSLGFDKWMPLVDGAWSYGFGFDADSIAKAQEDVKKADDKTRREKSDSLERAMLGFHLVHLAKPYSQLQSAAKDLGTTLDSMFTKEFAGKKSGWKTSWKPGPAGKGLPAGSLHYVMTREHVSSDPKEPKRPKATCHAFFTKDGEGSAIGLGCDDKVLSQKLAASLEPAKGAKASPGAPSPQAAVPPAAGHRGGSLGPRALAWITAVGSHGRRPLGAATPSGTALPMTYVLHGEGPSANAPGGTAVLDFDAPKGIVTAFVGSAISRR